MLLPRVVSKLAEFLGVPTVNLLLCPFRAGSFLVGACDIATSPYLLATIVQMEPPPDYLTRVPLMVDSTGGLPSVWIRNMLLTLSF